MWGLAMGEGGAVLVQTLSETGPVNPFAVTLSRKQTSVSGVSLLTMSELTAPGSCSTAGHAVGLGIDVLQVVLLGQVDRCPSQRRRCRVPPTSLSASALAVHLAAPAARLRRVPGMMQVRDQRDDPGEQQHHAAMTPLDRIGF